MNPAAAPDVTELLAAWVDGDKTALDRLTPLVYAELRRLARHYMRREPAGHTLETTALVHEAYLRLVQQASTKWQNRAHFFAISSQLMRRILVDMARNRRAQRRGGGQVTFSLDEALTIPSARAKELVALDDALTQLEKLDERRCRVVEMRFFGGLSVEETASVLRISPDTVMREWKRARAWLQSEMTRAGGEQSGRPMQ